MKPYRPTDTKKSRAVAQAKLRIKSRLYWVEGFAIEPAPGVLLWCVPTMGRVTLDGAVLSRAQRALHELHTEYASVLPLIVGDVGDWSRANDRVFGWVKTAIHAGGAPDSLFGHEPAYDAPTSRLANQLAASSDALRPLVHAASWAWLRAPERAQEFLLWLAGHAERLESLSPLLDSVTLTRLVLRLFAAHTSGALPAFIDIVLDARVYALPADPENDLGAVRRCIGQGDPAPTTALAPPTVTSNGRALLRWLEPFYFDWSAAYAQMFERLVVASFPADYLREVGGWYEPLRAIADRARLLQEASNAASGSDDHRFTKRARMESIAIGIEANRQALTTLGEHTPARFDLDGYFRDIGAIAKSSSEAVDRIEALVARTDPKDDTLIGPHWIRGLRPEKDQNLSVPMLRALQAIVEQEPGFASAFIGVFHNRRRHRAPQSCCIAEIMNVTPDDRWPMFFEALRLRLANGPLEAWRLDSLGAFVKAAPTAQVACEWFVESETRTGFADESTLEWAMQLADGRPETFSEIRKRAESSELTGVNMKLLIALCKKYDKLPMLRRWVLEGHQKRIAQIARRIKMLGDRAPTPWADSLQDRPAWIARFPATLHEALTELAQSVDGAEWIARRQLQGAGRSRQEIERELAVLRTKGDDAKIAKRIERLTRELVVPRVPKPARVRRVLPLLQSAASVGALNRWCEQLDREVLATMAGRLGLDDPPAEWESKPVCEALCALMLLDRDVRDIAMQILRKRLWPPPWDFREHPANASFVARMQLRGVSMAPWLNGIEPLVEHHLTLKLEDDPLQILSMGAHFQTCLSPYGCNFFSVFSNIIDINKRVLYARNEDGAVVGRALIALTADGAIIAFHPYHHGKFDFQSMVGAFVARLADAMHTVVLPAGAIPTLVAANWYDDGPVDVAERFAFLRADSDFRKELARLPPDQVVGAFARALAPATFDERTLPLVLNLAELQSRAPMLEPFVPIVARVPRLPANTMIHFANHLLADQRAPSLLPIRERLFESANRMFADRHTVPLAVIEWLAMHDASRVLRMLRVTRGPQVRAWDDEHDARRVGAAIALEGLNRSLQALALYESMAVRGSADVRGYCEAKAKQLRAEIE